MEEGKIVKFQVLDGRENQITIIIIIIENDDVQMFRKGTFPIPINFVSYCECLVVIGSIL